MTEQRSAEGFGLFHVGKVAGSFNYFKPGRGNGGADEGGGFGGSQTVVAAADDKRRAGEGWK